MQDSKPPNLEKFPTSKQRTMDDLLEKNANGTISSSDQQKLEVLVREAEELMVANAKLLEGFTKNQSSTAPPQAVPVTVWVSPDLAGT